MSAPALDRLPTAEELANGAARCAALGVELRGQVTVWLVVTIARDTLLEQRRRVELTIPWDQCPDLVQDALIRELAVTLLAMGAGL